jgi:hypothetical protein
MNRFLWPLLTALSIAPTVEARPSTEAMSCAEARGIVEQNGAVVMSTGRYTFERFVATPGHCMHGEQARRARAPTRDRGDCQAGYVCIQPLHFP